MATYLPTQEVLNVMVSCFANYNTPANPQTINLLTWLYSSQHRDKIETLRTITDKAQRDALKARLPAITPSGIFTYRDEASKLSHTHLVQFDIDLKDNVHIRNYINLKEQIARLPFVTFCGLSASGTGFWGLVPIAYPERHGQHVDALNRVFAYYGIYLDKKPRNVASLRGYSYDPAPFVPQKVMVFDLYDEPPRPRPRPFRLIVDTTTDRGRVERCIQEVLRRGLYLGNTYQEWYEVGCSLAKTFGETARNYFHLVSQNYPNYELARTDKQFTACLRANSKATLGTFFYHCQQQGIDEKDG